MCFLNPLVSLKTHIIQMHHFGTGVAPSICLWLSVCCLTKRPTHNSIRLATHHK